eukprot:1677036-Rhodomonas_salina.1
MLPKESKEAPLHEAWRHSRSRHALNELLNHIFPKRARTLQQRRANQPLHCRHLCRHGRQRLRKLTRRDYGVVGAEMSMLLITEAARQGGREGGRARECWAEDTVRQAA